MREQKNHEERIERLRAIISKKRLDAAILFSGESHNDLSSKSTYYLSGFFDSWPHTVIVTKKDEILFTGEPRRAEKESLIKTIIPSKKGALDKFLKSAHIKRLGVDANFSFSRWNDMKKKLGNGCSFKNISHEMIELRAIKDAEEIVNIRRASQITVKALKVAENCAGSGDENMLVQKIKSEIINNGAEIAFKPIVAGDANSANIHYFECGERYNKIVMADIGARWNFYNSDFTRTFVLGNDKNMIRAHETLENLVAELSDFIKPGIKCIDAFNYAKKFLEKTGYKKESFANFHSLGHGVGLDVHEYPVLTKNPAFKDARFEENMVFTIEPALYFKDKFGIRIEDTVVLTKNGVKHLTD
ncbi:MAG: Xaa-Pro peptidase family protein [Nanoarchaeota archaeon]|nr:Xaa-Pro peptidase family protein [Nanoarchaeota archaeon]MBU4300192.1 Xaa-Pro peptidase family protein [Nanoarchaeota archaeon]MBU4452066.1 Xaa-Pro peptidase family protein [Nanoarchaeota archaeon]MCG2724447.1 Xaa-Pro peptidase family protein [archaeon]